MLPRIAPTYNSSLQIMVRKYRAAGQKWPATSRDIARWCFVNGLWEPQEKNIVGQLARDIARALREEYYTDPQGRRVRTKHAARRFENELGLVIDADDASAPKVLWHDIRTDEPDHIITALQQRRMQIVGDCKQLKTDCESFNDNHPSGKKVQMEFDFRQDLIELDQPTEYVPPEPSPED